MPTPSSAPSEPSVTITPSEVSTAIVALRTGYKTSEFWVHLLFQLADFAVVIAPNNPAVVRFGGLLASLTGVASYIFGRSYVKGKAASAVPPSTPLPAPTAK